MYYSSVNVSVDELTGRGLMSVRAMNICKRSSLFDFQTIYAHYETHGSFAALPQMGKKTNESLIELCSNGAVQLHLQEKADDTLATNNSAALLKQPRALIAAYRLISDAGKSAAERVYGNLVCTLHRRAIRALLNLYKTKSLTGLVNGLEVKPSAFAALAEALLPAGVHLYGFLDKLTDAISGNALNDTIRDNKLRTLSQQIAQITRKADKRMEIFLAANLNLLETGGFPLNDFIHLLIQSDITLKADYKNAVLLSDLFYRDGLPPSKELFQKLNAGAIKVKRLYRHNGYHQPVYTQLAQGIRALQTQGLVTPEGFLLKEAPFYFFPDGLPNSNSRFTNRILAPLFICFNPDFRMFYQPGTHGDCVLFVNKKTEAWFDTMSFFSLIEKKPYLKGYADEDYYLMKLLSTFCRRTLSKSEQDELLAFVRPFLKHLYQHQAKPERKQVFTQPRIERKRQVRFELIYELIKNKDRHCHIDEIANHLTKNGETLSQKSLLKYLEKCNTLIKPVGACLFQLRAWDNQKRWQEETVLQLAVNFLSAHPAPQPIYTIGKHVMRYKKVSLTEVADVLLGHKDSHFIISQHHYFGLAEKQYSLPVPLCKSLPAYWQDVAAPLFISANYSSIRKDELVMYIMHRYKFTRAKSLMMIDIRVRLGEWEQMENGKLQLPLRTMQFTFPQPAQRIG